MKCFDLCAIKYPGCHGTPSIYTARRLAIVMYCLHTLRVFTSTCRPGDLWIQIDTRSRSPTLSPAHTNTHKRCVAAPGIQKQRANARSRQNRPAIPIFHINFLLTSQPRQYFATRIYIPVREYWTPARSKVECQIFF